MPDGTKREPTIQRGELRRIVRELSVAEALAGDADWWARHANQMTVLAEGKGGYVSERVREHLNLGPEPTIVKVLDDPA